MKRLVAGLTIGIALVGAGALPANAGPEAGRTFVCQATGAISYGRYGTGAGGVGSCTDDAGATWPLTFSGHYGRGGYGPACVNGTTAAILVDRVIVDLTLTAPGGETVESPQVWTVGDVPSPDAYGKPLGGVGGGPVYATVVHDRDPWDMTKPGPNVLGAATAAATGPAQCADYLGGWASMPVTFTLGLRL